MFELTMPMMGDVSHDVSAAGSLLQVLQLPLPLHHLTLPYNKDILLLLHPHVHCQLVLGRSRAAGWVTARVDVARTRTLILSRRIAAQECKNSLPRIG